MVYLTEEQKAQSFWKKVDIKSPPECWEWLGSFRGDYGCFKLGNYNESAHRTAFHITKGMKSYKNCVLHSCDNPKCVNPNHLFEGTQGDNMIDKFKKGRNCHTHGKLNSEAAKVIKWMLKYQPEFGLVTKLARLHNVSSAAITNIRQGRSWNHIKV